MTYFVLMFLLFTAKGPVLAANVFDNRFDCQVTEGQIATMAEHSPDVSGWMVVGEPCLAVEEAKKA